MASIFYNSVCKSTLSKEKQRKIKCLACVMKKTKAQAFVDV